MTDESLEKLRSLLTAYAERLASAQPPSKTGHGIAERKRLACADSLRKIVRPVLDRFMDELKNAGHDASTRDHTDREDAYPSVALSFTPRTPAAKSPETTLASALMFKYDPRHGIVVQREVKPSPTKRRVTLGGGERLGMIAVAALSAPWVETKALTFVEDVLKAN